MMNEQIIKELKAIEGVEDVKSYTLVNNYGFTFVKNGKHYDIRRWKNCYGADLGWQVFGTKAEEDTHSLPPMPTPAEVLEQIAEYL